jgi:hypothetical protein
MRFFTVNNYSNIGDGSEELIYESESTQVPQIDSSVFFEDTGLEWYRVVDVQYVYNKEILKSVDVMMIAHRPNDD